MLGYQILWGVEKKTATTPQRLWGCRRFFLNTPQNLFQSLRESGVALPKLGEAPVGHALVSVGGPKGAGEQIIGARSS